MAGATANDRNKPRQDDAGAQPREGKVNATVSAEGILAREREKVKQKKGESAPTNQQVHHISFFGSYRIPEKGVDGERENRKLHSLKHTSRYERDIFFVDFCSEGTPKLPLTSGARR